MAAYTELTLEQYADFTDTITLDDTQGNAINLSSYSAYSTIRSSPYSATFYNFNATITDNANGVITLSMNSANTANIPPNRYLYDVLIVGDDGSVTRVVEGIVTVTAGISIPPGLVQLNA